VKATRAGFDGQCLKAINEKRGIGIVESDRTYSPRFESSENAADTGKKIHATIDNLCRTRCSVNYLRPGENSAGSARTAAPQLESIIWSAGLVSQLPSINHPEGME
jgi:hypothetical protein